MESLKSDLKNVQGVIKDLLSQLSGELPVASWRFPEKLAANLDPLEELQSRDREEEGLGDLKTLLMELLVDRLLFLLQCCVRFSETSQGQKFTSLPLTLGSTVKKFSRKIQHDYASLKKTTEKVLVREEHIAVLEATVSELQSQSPLPHSHSITTVPSHDPMPIEPPSLVPYEALGTMKINRLYSSVAIKPSTKSIIEVKRTPTLTRGCSISTQTTETGFALCVQCAGTHQTLVELADTVINTSSTHKLKSELSTRDWAGLVSVGGLDTREWAGCFTTDLNALSHRASSQECRVEELEGQLVEQREMVLAMEGEIASLTAHVNHLQANVEEVRQVGDKSLASTQRMLGAQLRELRESVGRLETANGVVCEELGVSRKQESLLKARMAEIEARRTEVLRELQAVQSREMRLLSSQQTLERELEVAVGERAKVKEALEENKLQLTKTKIASQTMEKKNKAIFSKQSSLLSRLGQLDEECDDMRGRLWGVEREREALCEELTDIQAQCVGLRAELDTEKEKLSVSVSEGERLRGVCCELETQIKTTMTQLDAERERCRLLMDYPFVKQTRTGYVEHIRSLSTRESQKQISANTVRILLLEEQNSELRERGVAEVRERGTNSAPLLRAPVRMWRDGLLTQVHSEQAMARQAASSKQHSNDDRVVSPMIRPPSSGSLKGRLGHLVTAIADHRSNVDNSL